MQVRVLLRSLLDLYQLQIWKGGVSLCQQKNKDMNATVNTAFLASLDSKVKNEILTNIANHYGITTQEAFEEITDPEAESIMDYLTGNVRATASLFFRNFKMTFRG